MKIKTLFEDVLALGFEDHGEITPEFIYAARRAQRILSLEWGRESYGSILAAGIDTVYTVPLTKHHPSDVITYNAGKANAYSFKVGGKGEYSTASSLGRKVYSFDSPLLVCRGFIAEGGTLTFEGNGSFAISDLAFFRMPDGAAEDEIPVYSQRIERHIPDFIGDYLVATAAPTDADGYKINGASISGEVLHLPSDYVGEVRIRYRKRPAPIDPESNEAIDVPAVCEHLLPLLTSAYLWLDDSPDKSQYYMKLYREESLNLKMRVSLSVGDGYKNVTGWA